MSRKRHVVPHCADTMMTATTGHVSHIDNLTWLLSVISIMHKCPAMILLYWTFPKINHSMRIKGNRSWFVVLGDFS